jgi:hypothetical protein
MEEDEGFQKKIKERKGLEVLFLDIVDFCRL